MALLIRDNNELGQYVRIEVVPPSASQSATVLCEYRSTLSRDSGSATHDIDGQDGLYAVMELAGTFQLAGTMDGVRAPFMSAVPWSEEPVMFWQTNYMSVTIIGAMSMRHLRYLHFYLKSSDADTYRLFGLRAEVEDIARFGEQLFVEVAAIPGSHQIIAEFKTKWRL